MRPFIAYILLFAVMLPTFSPWGTVAYFHLNRSYIAKVLCENRSKPELKCNGKCYLAKKLRQQQEKKDRETTERVENTPVVQLFIISGFLYQFVEKMFSTKERTNFFYRLPVYISPFDRMLRPPQKD